jgi:AcrR family transcriptional regulator
MEPRKPSGPTGRPRSFDLDKALDAAMQVFWRKGYEGASLSELTHAMSINRPIRYSAFGDKEALFRKALDRYAAGPAAYVREALQQPTARAVTRQLLRGAADLLTDPHHPSGCLMVQSALVCGEASDCIRRELVSRRLAGEAAVRRRFERAKAKGDLPADANPADLARYVVTISDGMSVQAANGASRAELQRVVGTAMRAWPRCRVKGRSQVT